MELNIAKLYVKYFKHFSQTVLQGVLNMIGLSESQFRIFYL